MLILVYCYSHSITQQSFFYLIGEDCSQLTRALFRLAKMPLTQPRLSFDEYLLVVCSFASFSEPQVLKFFFDVYTSEPSNGTAAGTMVENDITKLGVEMQALQSAFSNNIKLATKRMATNRDVVTARTVLTFEDFERLSKQHMVAFFPLVQLQLNVRERTLGRSYWTQRMRENQAVQRLLVHMNRHHGLLPRLPWKDWLIRLVFNHETFIMRVRAQAKRIYAKQHRQHQPPPNACDED